MDDFGVGRSAAEIDIGTYFGNAISLDQQIAGAEIAERGIHADDACGFDERSPHVGHAAAFFAMGGSPDQARAMRSRMALGSRERGCQWALVSGRVAALSIPACASAS